MFIGKTKNYFQQTSKTPKRNKQNTINGNLHCSNRISSKFDKEISLIKEKFMFGDYPLSVINSAVKKFQKGKKGGGGMWKCGNGFKIVIHNMEN